MISRTTPSFRRALAQLPPDIRERADEAFRRFTEDHQHPGLRFKKVHEVEPVYSVRIARGYRALAVRREDRWVWFWVGSHAAYEALLKRL